MATERFPDTRCKRRPISYPDPTGNEAAARADSARAASRDQRADMAAIRDTYGTAPTARAYASRPLTNAQCIAAIIAARIYSPEPLGMALADAHTPDEETTWSPSDLTRPSWMDWWDSDLPTSAA